MVPIENAPNRLSILAIAVLLVGSSLLVLPASVPRANGGAISTGGSITLSSSSGPSGSIITVSGSGFGDETDLFSITMCCSYLGSVPVSSAPYYCVPDGAGSFSCDYPTLQTNSYYFCAVPTPTKTIGCVINALKGSLPFPPGKYTIKVDGELSVIVGPQVPLQEASASFTVTGRSVTLSQTSGAWGDTIYVSGTGFSDDPGVTAVTFSLQSLSSTTSFSLLAPCTFGGSCFAQTTPAYDSGTIGFCSLSQGSFTNCPVTIPNAGEQPALYYVTAESTNTCECDIGQALFSLEPTVTLSPSSGPVGTEVTVTGNGFGYEVLGTSNSYSDTAAAGFYGSSYPYGSIIVFGENHCPVSNFELSCKFDIPPTDWYSPACTPGPEGIATCQLLVCGSSISDCGTATFTQTPPMGISVSPSFDPNGESVTISGTGFSLSDTSVSATIGGKPFISGTSCPVSVGSFKCDFVIPPGVGSLYSYVTVTATGNSGDKTSTAYYVSQPGFLLSQNSGPAGTQLNAAYFVGYSPKDTSRTITFNGANVTPSGGCSGVYYIACYFTIPASTQAGTYPVTISGDTGDSASATFTVFPTISLVASQGPAGSIVAVTGLDFSTSDSSVTLELGSTIPAQSSCPVSQAGSFSCAFTVPSVSSGAYSLKVTGNSGDSASAPFSVSVAYISLNPSSAPAGTTVTVTASDLYSLDTSASLSFGSADVTPVAGCPVSGGSISCAFTVPPSLSTGAYSVTVKGNSGDSVTAPFTITVASLILTLNSGPPGQSVLVYGQGFSSANTAVSLSFGGGAPTSCAFSTGAYQFNCFITVPSSTSPGTYAVTAVGDVSGDQASSLFSVTPITLTISPTSGPVGSQITISGSGFPSSPNGAFEIYPVLGNPYADGFPPFFFYLNFDSPCFVSGGSFSCTYTVPASDSVTECFDGFCDTSTVYLTPGEYPIGFAQGHDGGGICGSGCGEQNPTFMITTPTVSTSPSSGPAGADVIITGSGFSGADASATISLGTTNVTPATGCPMVAGAFSCAFAIPSTSPPGSYAVKATADGGDSGSSSFAVTIPSVSVSPGSTPAGEPITVTGSGFTSTDTTAILLLGSTDVTPSSGCSVSGGSFSCLVALPAATALGDYSFSATGNTLDQASTTLKVTLPVLSTSQSAGQVGATVAVTGSGFSYADSSASLSFGGTNVTPAAGCSVSQGTFTCNVQVPSVPSTGSYSISATGTVGDVADIAFTVQPAISVSPTTGSPGGTVTISGSSFSQSDTSVTLTFGGDTGALNPSSCPVAGGSFTCQVDVPSTNSGLYAITAIGSSNGPGDSASTTFEVNDEALSLTQTSGPPGTFVGLLGSGFPGGSISYTAVSLGTTQVIPLSASDTSGCPVGGPGNIVLAPGSLSCLFSVPSLPPGAYTLTVTDPNLGVATTTFTVTSPSLSMTLSPTSGPAGASVSVSASGFPSTDTSVSVAFDGTLTPCPASGGTASCTVTAPSVPPDGYTVTASDASGNIAVSMFTVTLPAITGIPSSGPAGMLTALQGSGFSSSDTSIAISFDGQVLTTTSTPCTPSDGYFVCAITAPPLSPGTYTVAAVGDGPPDSASTSFTVTVPTVSVSPEAGPQGTQVTITGSGFPPISSFATVSLEQTNLVALTSSGTSSCPLNEDGTLSCTVTIPAAQAGPYQLTVSDLFGDSASATFTVTLPSIALSPSSGSPGSQATVTGSGFSLSDTSATIFLGGLIVVSPSACPASGGSFSCLITVPATAPNGADTVTATGSTGDSASATLTIKSPSAVSTSLSETTISAGQSVTDSATITIGSSPTGSISFYYSTSNSCPNSGATLAGGNSYPLAGTSATSGAVTLSTPGTYYWYAVYSGDSNNLGSTSQCEPLVVQATSMAVTAYSVTGAVEVGGTVSVSAAIQDTGQVALSSLVAADARAGPLACLATSLAPGASTTCTGTFTAPSSAGTVSDSLSASATDSNGAHLSASSGTVSTKVQDFALAATPASIGLVAGKTGTSQISLDNLDGFSGAVALSTSSVPSAITASLSSSSISGTQASTLTVGSQAAGTYTLTITGTSGTVTRTITVTIAVSYANCPQVPNKGGANLKGADLDYCNLAGYDMSGDNLMGASMRYTDLQGTNLQGANLKGVDLTNTDANGADFQGANLLSAVLTGATAAGADFQGANLMGDSLHGGNFMNADFQGANLKGDDLSYANFSGVNFQGANLMDSNMSYGDFDGANFTGANTNGADTTGATFVGAINPP